MPFVCTGTGVFASPPPLLFSLTALLSSLTFALLLLVVSSLFVSPFASTIVRFGALQVGTIHWTPVKLLIWKPRFSHFRHGFPLRSRARSPALIAPWLAFGPSF